MVFHRGAAALAVLLVLAAALVVTQTSFLTSGDGGLRATHEGEVFASALTDDAGTEDPDAVAQPFESDSGSEAAAASSDGSMSDPDPELVVAGTSGVLQDTGDRQESSGSAAAQEDADSVEAAEVPPSPADPSPVPVLALPPPRASTLSEAARFAAYRLDVYRSKGTEFGGVPRLSLTDKFVLETLRRGQVFELEKEFTSVTKTAFEVLLRADAAPAVAPGDTLSESTAHRQQLHAYFKIGDPGHGEHVLQEAISHAVDRVFGFYIVPPVVTRTVDLREVRGTLEARKGGGDEHAGAELELLDQAVRVARQSVKDRWKRTNSLELTGAMVLFYPHEVSTLQIDYRVDWAAMKVHSKHSVKLNVPTAEYLMLYYLLHCPKKRHNVQVDAHRRAFVGIDNDRCPFPVAVLPKPDFFLVCEYRSELAAALERYHEGDAACLAVRQFLRDHDPTASAHLEAVLAGERAAPQSSLLLTKMFARRTDPPGTCHLAKRVRTLNNVVKWCTDNAGRSGRPKSVLFPSVDALPPDARGA